MSAPLVSVIIPTFNSGDYIIDAIDSVLRQSYSPIEIVVVDSGSTDGTSEKLAHWIDANKIRYQYKSNEGPSAARNVGISLARGTYLQFLDADDVIAPTKIEKQVECLRSDTVLAICGSDFRFFFGSDIGNLTGGDCFRGAFPFSSPAQLFDFETVIHRWLFPTQLVCSIGGFDEDLFAVEDWLLLWKLAARGTKFIYLDEPLALYRRHGNNATRDTEKLSLAHLKALDKVETLQQQNGSSRYSKRALNQLRESYHYELGLSYLRKSELGRAWRHLLAALLLAPNRRQVKLLLLAAIPTVGRESLDRARSTDSRLWRWRALLRKRLVG